MSSSSLLLQKQYPSPPPATKNIWYLDHDAQEWKEGVLMNCLNVDKSHTYSTWKFFISTENEKTVSITSTSISTTEFDFQYVKNRSTSNTLKDFNSIIFSNEPEILRYLSHHYSRNNFYHRIGDVTIAMNPCQEVSHDCDQFLAKSSFYTLGHRNQRSSVAHAYETADAVFCAMCADKYNLDKRQDQTIFVLGSSGSGKSENVKLILQYLLRLSMKVLGGALDGNLMDTPRLLSLKSMGASSKNIVFDSSLEGRFTSINTIMESMCNACRPINSNSSRIARVYELGYAADCYIEDMSVDTFLFEADRVHTQNKRERNFHIFYELIAGSSTEFKEECGVESAGDFRYLNQGGVLKRCDGVSDAQKFQLFCDALNNLGISDYDQDDLLRCLSAILHLGNLDFSQGDTGAIIFSKNSSNNRHVDYICRMLSIKKQSLQNALLLKSITSLKSSKKVMSSSQDVAAAEISKNNLSKTMYQLLFQWLLKQYDKLRPGTLNTPDCISSITLMDIFATENTGLNNFTQFCINYCSERVYNHYVTTLFKKEQERYTDEGISWNFVSYWSNEDCVEMYENPDNGILSILEAEARVSCPTDTRLLNQIISKVKSNHFTSSQRDVKLLRFTVNHHIGHVSYDAHGFTERNKITSVGPEVIKLFSDSRSPFVNGLAEDLAQQTKQENRLKFLSSASRTKTVTTGLHKQIDNLLEDASLTKQHWLICMKPSTNYAPGKFDDAVVLDQIVGRGLVPLLTLAQKGKYYIIYLLPVSVLI